MISGSLALLASMSPLFCLRTEQPVYRALRWSRPLGILIMYRSSMTDVFHIDSDSNEYPQALRAVLGRKAPGRISCKGNIELLGALGIGFCGSRNATSEGLRVAYDCAQQAGSSCITVISGNAKGVDAAAHLASLKAGGSTIIVLPEGISRFRPRAELREVISWDRTLVISQFNDDAVWRAHQAMTRNKTIIALSFAMIVIEAGESGGTLDAGKTTLQFDLPLFVADYQGPPGNRPGNEILLRQGGRALGRSRSSGLANMTKVFDLRSDKPPSGRQGLLL